MSWAAFEYSIYQFLQIGTCASGGPYVSARPCPAGTGIYFAGLFGGIILGLIAIGVYATRGTPPDVFEGEYRGPRVSFGILAWSLLFLGTAIVGLVGRPVREPGAGRQDRRDHRGGGVHPHGRDSAAHHAGRACSARPE